MKRVTHFVRKQEQLKTVFINQQICNHINYKASVVYKYPSKSNSIGFAQKDIEGLPVLSLTQQPNFVNYYYIRQISSYNVKSAINFLREQRTDVLHFHFGSDAYIFTEVMKQAGVPSVVSFYGYDISSVPRFMGGLGVHLLKRGAFKHASCILAMSPDMKADLISAGCPAEKIVVHYYGVPTTAFRKIDRSYKSNTTVELLIIGNLQPKKGHLFLFNSLQKLMAEGFNQFKLNIVGAGPEEDKLRKFALNSGLSNHVIFHGSAKFLSDKMIAAITSADIFIHPSVVAPNGDKEGIPGTIVEAMASGLPVISTLHAGIPYVIDNEHTGILVKEWDTNDLARRIKELASNVSLREKIGGAAKEYAARYLEQKHKQQELESIYDHLISSYNRQ